MYDMFSLPETETTRTNGGPLQEAALLLLRRVFSPRRLPPNSAITDLRRRCAGAVGGQAPRQAGRGIEGRRSGNQLSEKK